jgi:hypothetical protein
VQISTTRYSISVFVDIEANEFFNKKQVLWDMLILYAISDCLYLQGKGCLIAV